MRPWTGHSNFWDLTPDSRRERMASASQRGYDSDNLMYVIDYYNLLLLSTCLFLALRQGLRTEWSYCCSRPPRQGLLSGPF